MSFEKSGRFLYSFMPVVPAGNTISIRPEQRNQPKMRAPSQGMNSPMVTTADRPGSFRIRSATVDVIDLVRQVVLLSGAALLYFGVRVVTVGDKAVATAHAESLMSFERWLHIDFESVLQGRIIGNQVLVTAANWVYIFGHWPVILASFVWLYTRHRPQYRRLRNAMFVSGAIGLLIFWQYPVAPPRLAASNLVDTVTQFSHTYRVLQPPNIENKYASLPSLHVGWNLLIGLTVAVTARHWILRSVAAVSPLAMAAAVVLTANHYIIDVALGATVALVGLAVSIQITPDAEGRIPIRRWLSKE